MSDQAKAVVLFLATTIFSAPLRAQDSGKQSWDNLNQLQPGQKIEVVDMNLKSYKGTFVAVSDEAISLRVKKDEVTVVIGGAGAGE